MKAKLFRFFAAMLLLGTLFHSGNARATIVNSADVIIAGNSYGTFLDQNTNLTWLDLDNFWGGNTANSIMTLLAGSGFHLANAADVAALVLSMPAVPANFATEVAIVGGNYSGNTNALHNRDIMWGIYDDGGNSSLSGWLWRNGAGSTWSFSSLDTQSNTTTFLSVNTYYGDLGAWIVSDAPLAQTPLPAALPLFATGLGALGLLGWRRKKKAAAIAA